MTAGPDPTLSKAIFVPSLEVTVCMVFSYFYSNYSLCWLVNKCDDATTQCPRLPQPELPLRAAFSEESLAQHYRMDQQAVLIDRVMLHEHIDQIAPAVEEDGSTDFALELFDFFRGI